MPACNTVGLSIYTHTARPTAFSIDKSNNTNCLPNTAEQWRIFVSKYYYVYPRPSSTADAYIGYCVYVPVEYKLRAVPRRYNAAARMKTRYIAHCN